MNFLNIENQGYLDLWELDITKLKRIDREFEKTLEKRISQIFRLIFHLRFEVNTKEERLFWESKITSTLSNAAKFGEIKPSENWLGKDNKIRESGLWQVNELYV